MTSVASVLLSLGMVVPPVGCLRVIRLGTVSRPGWLPPGRWTGGQRHWRIAGGGYTTRQIGPAHGRRRGFLQGAADLRQLFGEALQLTDPLEDLGPFPFNQARD